MERKWRQALERARKRLGVSRLELASLTGLSVSTIRAYEEGSRQPKHDSLQRLLASLRLERVEANAIRQGAGFPPVPSLFADVPSYYFSIDELDAEVEEVPWPEFVANDSFEVVAANKTACAIWGVDFREERTRREPHELNLLAVATENGFAARVENWDEILELLASMYKDTVRGAEEVATPGPYLMKVLGHLLEADPTALAPLLDAWDRAQPAPPKVRETYRIIWNDPEHGRLNFYCLLTTANERDGLAFNDWIPADAQTWVALDAIVRTLVDDPEARHARFLRPRAQLNDRR